MIVGTRLACRCLALHLQEVQVHHLADATGEAASRGQLRQGGGWGSNNKCLEARPDTKFGGGYFADNAIDVQLKVCLEFSGGLIGLLIEHSGIRRCCTLRNKCNLRISPIVHISEGDFNSLMVHAVSAIVTSATVVVVVFPLPELSSGINNCLWGVPRNDHATRPTTSATTTAATTISRRRPAWVRNLEGCEWLNHPNVLSTSKELATASVSADDRSSSPLHPSMETAVIGNCVMLGAPVVPLGNAARLPTEPTGDLESVHLPVRRWRSE